MEYYDTTKAIEDYTIVIDSCGKWPLKFFKYSNKQKVLEAALYSRAQLNYGRHFWARTVSDLLAFGDLDTLSMHKLNLLGVSYSKLRYWDKAVSYLRLAYRKDSSNCEALVNIGQVLLYEAKYSEALPYFTRLTALRPDAQSYLGLAISNHGLKNYAEAEKDFEKSILLNPDYADAYYHYGDLKLSLKDTASACVYITRAASLGYELSEDDKKMCIVK